MHVLLDDKFGKKIDLESVNDELRSRDLPFRFLGNGIGDMIESDTKPLTYIMTWHSSKGLDFETVALPDFGASMCRCNPFYVALTRSRRNLILAYSWDSNDQVEKAKSCNFVKLVSANADGSVSPKDKGPAQQTLF